MDLQLVRLCQAGLRQPLAYILSLVPLQLQHLPVLRVLYYCPIAGKLLCKTYKKNNKSSLTLRGSIYLLKISVFQRELLGLLSSKYDV